MLKCCCSTDKVNLSLIIEEDLKNDIIQFRDNADGGNNGPETVTLTDMATNSMFTYLLAANDYNFGNNGDDLLQSCTTFSVQNNIQEINITVPLFRPKIVYTINNLNILIYF